MEIRKAVKCSIKLVIVHKLEGKDCFFCQSPIGELAIDGNLQVYVFEGVRQMWTTILANQ